MAPGTKQLYLKLRDREAYEFALASSAIVMQMNGRRIERVRIALGGVGTRPWRSVEAEKVLEGHTVDAALFRKAADAALAQARPASENGYKVELSKRCLVRALTQTVALA
jgi:xanthine dehydrogenase YagS FAD-binding subunit